MTIAIPTFPTSTSTSFDDLMTIKAGQHFVLRGYEYRALGDAVTAKRKGVETVTIHADRRHHGMRSGWELATVSEWRTYEGPLAEICD